MSESFQVSDPCARLGIVMNQDGTITRDQTRLPRVPASPVAVVSKDIVVNHSNSTWMRLYVPTTALNVVVSTRKLPLVVYFHGGAFINHSVDFKPNHEFCNHLARECNVVVASASYRLAPEFKLPTAYLDGVHALKWLRHSEDVWIRSYADLSNVFLMGSNSGGNLAYNAALRSTSEYLTPLFIRGLILQRPFFGGQKRCVSELRHENDQAVGDLCWKLCLPDGADRDHKYSNPRVGNDMEIIRQRGWKAMVIGEGEVKGGVWIDRQRDVVKLMKEKGVDVVERFTDEGNVFASITSFIYSSAPLWSF
ncbi:unnamed protein product [Eruca vesicaria subsp. sativa]|uniref:Alpha/beta hydrolase fold-3 domain-containing protein n=1 Tax=Eruca vesicaria subsp. sativa TaxID=29727 RepID=A0ABC8KRN1_ERUVS|nr:unnamed protein product [Eruca vesicaria subsp. sativa]